MKGNNSKGIRFICLMVIPILFFPSANAQALENVSVQLRWDHQFQFAGYYAAKWQGYYADAGFDADIRSAVMPDGKILRAVDEVAKGNADFGTGGADIILARDRGVPLVVLLSVFKQSAARLYALDTTRLSIPADLLSLRVARSVNSLVDIEMQSVLMAEGIDPKKIKPYPLHPGLNDLIEGRVDVIPGYILSEPFRFRQKGIRPKLLRPADYGIDFYGDSLFTSQRMIETDPDGVERFVQATEKGWIYALENAESVAERISDELPRTAKIVGGKIHELNRFQIDGVKELTLYPIAEIGHINPNRWRRMNELMQRIGVIKNRLDIDAFIFDPQRLKAERELRQNALIKRVLLILIPAGLLGIILVWIIALRKAVNSKTAELQESEKQFRAMFENNYAVMLMIDPETGSIILSNRAAVRYYGYSSEQFADMTIYQINQSAEEEIRAAIREAETEKYNCFHFPHRLANGEIRDVEVHSSPIPFKGKTILFSIVHDVTERRKAEKIIRKQAHLLDLIFEHSLDSIVLLDSEYNFIRVSETYARACQRDVSEFPGHNHFEFYPTELKNEFDEAAKEKKICQRFARPFVFEDHPEWGTTYWDLGLVPILDQEGKIELFLFTLKDVTESRRAEDALKKSEEHLRLITDNLPALVSHVDRNLNCLFANRAYRTYCSVNPEDLIGKKISEVLDKNGFDRVYPYLQKVLKGEFVSVENGLSGKDGRDTFFQVNYVPQIENSEVTGYFVLGWDITERKRAEAQIREYSERLEEMVLERTKSLEAAQAELLVKERLAVLGHFSGSVAHEIRNPLAVIDSAAYLLNMKLGSSDERIAEILKRITANVRKASGIIQSLLDLSRMKKPAAEPHNITDLIRESIEISRIPDTVKVVTNLPEDTVLLRADFQQIRMVLKNIINNAVQAMENEGKLTISAGQLKDGQIEIVIADIGPGIAPEYLEKVFEPLFSTKAHGIGFGLSITKMIIENHGGTIRAESEPGKGAAFTVILPFGGLA